MIPRLDALVGHGHVVADLARRVERGRLPHALLLEGPDGVGKRTTAEALAALLLCRRSDRLGACGACPSCAQVGHGAHPDLVRLAPNEKNNIVKEHVSQLVERLHLRSFSGGSRVGLIEDAHRMNSWTQNALLKTLEEAPPHTHLLLVTDRPQLLLPTIQSRCQRVRFGPLSRADVGALVARRLPQLDEQDREILAAAAEGAPGRALAFDLEALLERREVVMELDARIDADHPRAALHAIDAAQEHGRKERAALAELLQTWTSWSRDQVWLAAGLPPDEVAHPDQLDVLADRAQRRGLTTCLLRTDALLEARRQLDHPNNLNAAMITEQAFLTLLGVIPLRRIPLEPVQSAAGRP